MLSQAKAQTLTRDWRLMMFDAPNMPDKETSEDDDDSENPARILSAITGMMHFVENLQTRMSMLEDMKLAPQAKWEAIATHMKNEAPKLKEQVSKDMNGFVRMLLRSARPESSSNSKGN